ncbi:bax inhibitor 1-like [Phalaenopsis equestris]|uniref:bax inhibitor 1-like n=1 Tax=Phalaenopsis equestris TaxID=78828 RepID=UPI0009E46BDC|nr:bax inhibitor 1-like [Phalaenopsis equestris]
MEAFFEGQSGNWGYESLKNFRQISPSVQKHLKLVYLTLCSALVASAAGVYLHILFNVGGIITTLACFVGIIFVMNTPPSENRKRLGYLMAASVLEGASIGPLFEVILDFDPRILVMGFVGTSLGFACFSGAAIVSKRREFLYLGGLLSAGFSILFWLRFASYIFGASASMFNVELYLGLLIFLGYIVFDTQEIIEKAHHGDLDYVKHALTLFTDFVAVLVRILIIMVKNSEKKRENKRKKRS